MGILEMVSSKFNEGDIKPNLPKTVTELYEKAEKMSKGYNQERYEECKQEEKKAENPTVTAADIIAAMNEDLRTEEGENSESIQDKVKENILSEETSPYGVENKNLLRNPLLSGFNGNPLVEDSQPKNDNNGQTHEEAPER